MESKKLIIQLYNEGYSHFIGIPGCGLCAIQKFIFTWGLVCDLNENGYRDRYCYATEKEALNALYAWDGIGHPGGDWIKHKGINKNGIAVNENNPKSVERYGFINNQN